MKRSYQIISDLFKTKSIVLHLDTIIYIYNTHVEVIMNTLLLNFVCNLKLHIYMLKENLFFSDVHCTQETKYLIRAI